MFLDHGQLPCGCYADDECSECSPWGPSFIPDRPVDTLLEARARRAHLELEADAQAAAA